MKEYRQTPDYKEQRKQYDNKYRARNKAKICKIAREYRARKKLERQGEGTLDAFLK